MSTHTEFTKLITVPLSSHLTSLSPSLYVRSLLLAPSSFQSVLTPIVLPSLIRQYINLSRVEMRKITWGRTVMVCWLKPNAHLSEDTSVL